MRGSCCQSFPHQIINLRYHPPSHDTLQNSTPRSLQSLKQLHATLLTCDHLLAAPSLVEASHHHHPAAPCIIKDWSTLGVQGGREVRARAGRSQSSSGDLSAREMTSLIKACQSLDALKRLVRSNGDVFDHIHPMYQLLFTSTPCINCSSHGGQHARL